MDFLSMLSLRVLRRAFPILGALLVFALISHDPTRAWLMEKWQQKAERRVERVVDAVRPSPAATPAS